MYKIDSVKYINIFCGLVETFRSLCEDMIYVQHFETECATQAEACHLVSLILIETSEFGIWCNQSSAINADHLVILSDIQWYDSSNSFTLNYTISIESQSSKIRESGIIIFNDDAGSRCNSYSLSILHGRNNKVWLNLQRFEGEDREDIAEEEFNDFVDNQEYHISITMDNTNSLSTIKYFSITGTKTSSNSIKTTCGCS